VTHCPALTLLLLRSSLLLLRSSSTVRWRGRCYAAATPTAGVAGAAAAATQKQHRPLARPAGKVRWRGQTNKQTSGHPGMTIRPTLCERDATDKQTKPKT